jgi:Ca2+-binding EF-hand superfamily protein
LPSRAVKEILQAADENRDGMISVEEVEHLLDHIDKRDRLSQTEIREILQDLGASDDQQDMVPVQTIKDLLSNK